MRNTVNNNADHNNNNDPDHFTLEELNYDDIDDGTNTRWQHLMEFAMSRADTVKFFAPTFKKKSLVNKPIRGIFAADRDATPKQQWQNLTTPISDQSCQWEDGQWSPPDVIRPSLKKSFSHSDGMYFLFYLTPEVEVFLRSCKNLTSWGSGNDLPEDPAFYAKDKLILWTISHENMVYCSTAEGFPSV